ncbi:LysR family transcriptional regulator [Stella humosa]|uniref:LysR family transcriptional regulator n=1 Tax=Stella humosa TaxID=94 RepID=A0A3N1MDX8_9PROT|nr:LysR family transcriptional regulator [Stella humosa]ROQ01758.1 LysR family transcriptional regulator [Stella humosa]BBK32141.1 transcriptional regulator [Stella humosa]
MAIELNHLRQFVVLAEELHFGRAAARLGVAQPPLSQAIRRLEERLGFSLFDRSGRQVELSPAGRVFLVETQRSIAQADDAVMLARRAAAEEEVELTIGFVVSALFGLLPATLRAFRAEWPDLSIRLDQRPSIEQATGLAQGTIDIGFLHPPLANAEGVALELIRRDRLVAAVPEDSPFARSEDLHLSDLAGQPFILFPCAQGPHLHARIIQACRAAGFVPRVTQEARQMHAILMLVASGMGVSLLPSLAIAMAVPGVRLVPITDLASDLTWDMAIAWRPKGARRSLLRFIEVARALAPAYAAGDGSGAREEDRPPAGELPPPRSRSPGTANVTKNP